MRKSSPPTSMEEEQALQKRKFYWGNTPDESEYYELHNINSTNALFTSPRGLSLFTRSWLPLTSPRGIICMVHGYGNDISWTFQATAIFLAASGYACFAVDMEGHGRSEGLKAFVPNVDYVVEDYLAFFDSIITSADPNYQNLPKFLFGESMGGAICLLIECKRPNFFDGAILIAPMCKISDKVRPSWPIPEILMFVSKFAPTLAIVPTADLVDKSVKVPEKRIIGGMNPMRYTGKPRLGTVTELLRVTDYLSRRLSDVNIPFIVLHGNADAVTDPAVSEELYEKAKSKDKSLKIYDGMMHSLLFGETDENVKIVRGDILSWLNDRS
ncbi:caffeoylshikimate esterase [Cynara cardunculus var. scolymus]|nr:caffeoylshikimate esterase [Cynara cardunculus var. scolymus]